MTVTTEKVKLVENFWNMGTCLQISAKRYGGNAKVSDSLVSDKGFDPSVVKAMNSLFTKEDMEKLKVFNSLKSKVKTFLNHNSLETPYSSTYFIPNARVEAVNNQLKEFQIQWLDCAGTFCRQYSFMKNKFQYEHPELYNESKDKYPEENELRKMFDFSWRFTEVQAPSGLSSEIQESETKKIKESANVVINSIIGSMITDLTKRIEKLGNKLESGNAPKNSLKPIINFCKSMQEFKSDFIEKDLQESLLEIQRIAESNDFLFDGESDLKTQFEDVLFPLEDKLEEISEQAEENKSKRALMF